MEEIKLKAELFDIRRQLDIIEAERQRLINLYNEKLRRLNEAESKSKVQDREEK